MAVTAIALSARVVGSGTGVGVVSVERVLYHAKTAKIEEPERRVDRSPLSRGWPERIRNGIAEREMLYAVVDFVC